MPSSPTLLRTYIDATTPFGTYTCMYPLTFTFTLVCNYTMEKSTVMYGTI